MIIYLQFLKLGDYKKNFEDGRKGLKNNFLLI